MRQAAQAETREYVHARFFVSMINRIEKEIHKPNNYPLEIYLPMVAWNLEIKRPPVSG